MKNVVPLEGRRFDKIKALQKLAVFFSFNVQLIPFFIFQGNSVSIWSVIIAFGNIVKRGEDVIAQ
ncbi:MAG: hypothetical protein L3J98_07160 [Gammaproteobacteria bacterium]|nr:hypothetical protein [Gammaproteobacteria bacterium]MCF6259925.1 hypothetical protein [Gammaproteobacteria bacterium]